MANGLGLADYLGGNPDDARGGGGGQGDFHGKWRKDTKTAASFDFWLCTHPDARIKGAHLHTFPEAGEKKADDGSDRKVKVLRFPTYVGLETDKVYAEMRFRINDGPLQTPPRIDPFMIIKEWLRLGLDRGIFALDTPVFGWTDYKANNAPIEWCVGRLSGRVKSNQVTWSHTLDAKYQYFIPCVAAGNLALGPKLTREAKQVGLDLQKVIGEQVEANGEEDGNPLKNPYAFRVKYDPSKSFGEQYSVIALGKNVMPYTDDVFYAIEQAAPNVLPYITRNPGADLPKLRAAFQAAMLMELPLDYLFSENEEQRMSLMQGAMLPTGKVQRRAAPADSGAAPRPGPQPGAARPAAAGGARPPAASGARPPSTSGARPPSSSGARPPAAVAAPAAASPSPARRMRVVEPPPEPPPPPPVEMLPCGNTKCGKPFPGNETKCPYCGTVCEVVDEDGGPPEPQGEPQAESPQAVGSDAACELCGQAAGFTEQETPSGNEFRCNNCNAVQGDVPF